METDLRTLSRLWIAMLLATSSPATAAPSVLADAQRRADRGDHSGALKRLEAVDRTTLDAADQQRHDRIAADAHLRAAMDGDSTNPGAHLTEAFEAHKRCIDGGDGPHGRHCASEARVLSKAIADRASRLAAALELGGAVSSVEIADRCEQLRRLAPADVAAPRCLARLAWARSDADRANEAIDWALDLPASEGRDVALAQATTTLLHGLGDVEATRAAIARVSDPGPRMQSVQGSLTTFETKLLPNRPDPASDTPSTWKPWLLALSKAGLHVLATNEADRGLENHGSSATYLEISASVRTRAAAAVPKSSDVDGRNRRILALLREAQRDLAACATLPDAPDRCAASEASVRAQIDQLAARLP